MIFIEPGRSTDPLAPKPASARSSTEPADPFVAAAESPEDEANAADAEWLAATTDPAAPSELAP